MQNYSIGGGAVAITKNGKLVYNRGFGFSNRAGTDTAKPYNLYRIASLSKPITSIAIMKLIQNGLLSITDTVFGSGRLLNQTYYLGAIADSRIYNITIKQLLEHTAGWDRSISCDGYSGCDPIDFPLHVTSVMGEPNPVGDSTLIKFLITKGLNHTPGTTYAYSNIGYLVLGKVIEKITGVKYEDYVKTHILDSIGVYDMHLGKNLLSAKQEREGEYNYPYTTASCYGTGLSVPWQYGGLNIEAMNAHGQWIATAQDLVRLVLAVDGFSTVPDILNSGTISTMTTPSTPNPFYAKGWSVNPSNNWWHNGSLPGTATELVRTAGGYTWALLFNRRSDTSSFWTALDNLGWNCIGSVSTFPTYDLFPPSVNVSGLAATATSCSTAQLTWTNGNGTGRLVLATETSSIRRFPTDGTVYTAGSAYGSGSNLGDTTYVVYAGSGNTVNVSGLNPLKTYIFTAFEYYNNTTTGNNIVYKEGNRSTTSVNTSAFLGTITGASSVCTGATTTLTNTAGGGTWTSSATHIASIGSGTGTVLGVSAGTATISYTLGAGCFATKSVTVTIAPGAITGTTTVCTGATTTLSCSSSGGAWSSSNTSVAAVGSSTGIITGITAGTATITYTLGTGCTAATTVTVIGAPTVTLVSPSIAIPGTSVTITGTNFNSTPANNVVYFGATQATVSSASSTFLTVSVPLGATYMPVSVNNTSCALTGYSQHSFLPTFSGPVFTGFDTSVDFATGNSPTGIAISDIDGDGKADIAISNYNSNTVSIYRNTSTSGSITASSFTTGVNFPTSNGPLGVSINDIDGDGKPDLIVVNQNSNTVSIYRNTAASGSITLGSFASRVDFPTGTGPHNAALTDIDGDGKPDLAIANYNSNNVSVLHNISSIGSITTGSFATRIDFPVTSHPLYISVGDLDGDGKPDIVVDNHDVNTVSILHNTATRGYITSGSFASNVDFFTGSNPANIAIGDIDGDGKPDLTIANQVITGSISVLRNTSTSGTITSASFAPRVDFTTSSQPNTVAVGDIDGDGKLDITVANMDSFSVFINTATTGSITGSSFATTLHFNAANSANVIAVGDLDGDSRPDLAITNTAVNTFSVFRFDPASAAPVFTNGSPQNLTACSNPVAAPINSLLQVTDADAGQTLTWTITSGPAHGSLSGVASYTATSTSGTVTPAGMTYTPTSGYSGTDAFTIQVSDGASTATTSITVTVNPSPSSITGSSSICHGSTTTLGNATSGGVWSSSNSGIATIGSTTGTVVAITSGTATITYTLPTGCITTTSVTIHPLPSAITVMGGSTGIITTVAGNGLQAYGGDGGPATLAHLHHPASVTVDASGNIYIADIDNVRIRKVNSSGIITTIAGNGSLGFSGDNGPATAAEFVGPGDALADGSGNVYIVDRGNGRVRKVDPSGIITTFAGGGSSGLGDGGPATAAQIAPSSIAIDGSGNMYIADRIFGDSRIRKVNTSGIISTIAGSSISGFFGDGGPATLAKLNSPNRVAVDGSGNVYISDFSNGRIRMVNTSGIISTIAGYSGLGGFDGDGPATARLLANPFGLAADNSGNVYIGDFSNARVRKVTAGIMTTIAGIGSYGFSGDGGPATAAAINSAVGVGLDANGNVYISDQNNQRIRKIHVTTDAVVCIGSTINLVNGSSGGTWSSSNSSIAIIGSGTGVVTGVGSGIANITYTLAGGCFATIAVTVNAAADSISGATNVCTASSTTLSCSPGGGNWSSSNIGIATIGSNSGIVTGVSAGSVTISYTVASTCGSVTVTRTLTVDTTPGSGSISGASSVSVGGNITLTNSVTGGTWSSSSPAIATVGSTGIVTGVSPGGDTIRYTVTNTCGTAVATKVVTVTPSVGSGACNIITTLAGNGTGGYSGDGGPATAALLAGPTGIAVDGSGNIYFSDGGNNAIRKIDASGVISTIAGTGTVGYGGDGGLATAALLNNSFGVAVDGSGNIYIADNFRVRKISTSGTINSIAGNGSPGYSGDGGPATNAQCTPAEIAVDGFGNIYFSEYSSNTIRKVNTAGIISTVAGNGTNGFSGDGGPATNCQLSSPFGVAVDGSGNIYVVDANNSRVRKIDTSGIISTIAGDGVIGYGGDGGPATNGSFGIPIGIAVDGTGNIFVTDMLYRVRKVNASGIFSTYAGNGTIGGPSGDGGPATAAQVSSSHGVAVDMAGNLFIAEYSYARIRKVTADISAITGPSSVCVGNTITLTDATPGGTWSSSNTGIATVGSGTGVVTGAAPGTATITYSTGTGCDATIVITVNPLPAAITGTTTFCIGTTATLSSSPSGGTWSSSNPSVASVGSGSGIVTGVTPGTANIIYTLASGCAATNTVTVTSSPGAISGPSSVCTAATIGLANATPGGMWSSSNTAVATVGSVSGIVTGVASGSAVISYSLGGSCDAITTVNVLSLPVIPAISGVTSVCIGLTTTLSNSMPGGFWYSTDVSKATVSSSGLVTGISGGSVSIVYAVANSCGIGFNSVFVNVSAPTPITGVASVCVGASSTLSHSSPGGTWTSSSIAIASVGSSSGIVTGLATGTATITYTLSPGCYSTHAITVNSSSALISGANTVCVTLSTVLTGSPTGGTWSSSNLSVATIGSSTGTVVGLATGITNITYTLSSGCYTVSSFTVSTTAGAITGVAGVCTGSTTTLVPPMPGGIWSSASTFFAAVGSATGIVYGASPGTSLITYSLGGGCLSTITVTVRPLPAIIPVSGGGTMCMGGPGVNIGLPASAIGISYQLYLGGLLIGSPLTGTGSSLSFGQQTMGGVYTVRATDPVTLCQSIMAGSANITVFPLPIISASPGVSICSGGSTTLTASGGISYTWSPATGLSSTVGSSISASPGTTTTYTVTGTNSFGCTNRATVTVTVNPLPTISAGSGVSICNGASTILTASGGISYTWSPSTGLSATTGASVSASPGTTRTYTVTGTSSNGCTNRATVTVTVHPLPGISAGPGVSICNGASTVLTASGGISYTWLPPIGLSATTGASVSASPGTTTTYTVTGINSNGCANKAFVTVTVNPSPIISVSPGVSICFGSSSTLTASGCISYTWSPGIGLSATVGAIVSASPGTTTTYTVTGTNSFGCTNRAMVTVTVNPLPTISAGSGVSICNGASTILTASGGNSYTWSPSTGLSATTGASVSASPGTTRTYTVAGTNSAGCTNRATVTVTVSPLPTISASSGISICNGSSTTLTASGGVSYTWSPGTGLSVTTGASVTASPTVTTTYTVTGTNGSGCTNGTTVTVTVNSTPTVSASSSGAICSGASATLSAAGAVSYVWSPSTGLSATTGATVTASPTVTTTYTVTGANSTGCTNRATVIVSVNASPSAISPIGSLCMGSSASLSNSASGGIWSSSNPSVGTIGSSTGIITGIATGTTTISYTLSSGCRATLVVTVVATPSAISGPGSIFTGSTVTYTNATSGGTWSSSNTAIVSIGSSTGIATGVATGSATITYSASSGCRTTLTVSVSATPTVFSVTGGGIYCTGGAAVPIGLSNSQVGVTYRLYNGGVPTGSPVSGTGGPITFGTFTIAGTYTAIANPTSSSPVTMSGSATITVIISTMLPAIVTVGGGGSMCAGSPGVPVTLPGSAVTVDYQLYRNGILTGSPVPGTGTALSLGLQTVAGTYTVIATSTVNGCSRNMASGANVSVYPTPNVYNITGGGSYCSGGAGVVVGLSNSQTGVSYQLYNGSSTVGSTRPGTGSAISFGFVTAAGSYSVVGITSVACTANMSGTATVSVNPTPTISGSIYTVAPAASISLTGSVSGGVWYSSTPSIATVGSTSGSVTGVALGTTAITYVLPTGCQGTRSISVTPTGFRNSDEDTAAFSAVITRNLYVHPNPSKGTFTIEGTMGSANEEQTTIEVTNMLGQVIYRNEVIKQNAILDHQVHLGSNTVNGIYILTVKTPSDVKLFYIVLSQ